MSKAPIIIVFGVTGDLSRRKLLPALYHLLTDGLLDPETKIIGTSRRKISIDELLSEVELCVLERENVCNPHGLKRMKEALTIIELDPNEPGDYKKLRKQFSALDPKNSRNKLLYMAIPPDAYLPIIAELGKQNINDERTLLLVEKPFGHDTASAQELIDATSAHFKESQIYRIDHYLAKETVQNLLTFRLHNPIFTPLWNGQHISSIHVRAAEQLGVENRVVFYEQTGALRDIIQSHLMQLLAIIMMDQPTDSSSDQIHAGKEAFLRSLKLANPDQTVRGQYAGYKDETNNQTSHVETYARIELESSLSSWQDTEIVLETGKALDQKVTEVIVQFKHAHEPRKNSLRFRLQPDEGISLDLVVKVPGFDDRMQHTHLDFSYQTAFGDAVGHPDAYERVIMDAVRADRALFASSQELVHAWRIVEPIVASWQKSGKGLRIYQKGAKHPDGV